MWARVLGALRGSDSLGRVARTFLITFIAVTATGFLDWLHQLTGWASGGGQAPFPDATSVGFLAVSGIIAGVVAVVNLLVVWAENTSGKALLRKVSSSQRGSMSVGEATCYVVVTAAWLYLVLMAFDVI